MWENKFLKSGNRSPKIYLLRFLLVHETILFILLKFKNFCRGKWCRKLSLSRGNEVKWEGNLSEATFRGNQLFFENTTFRLFPLIIYLDYHLNIIMFLWLKRRKVLNFSLWKFESEFPSFYWESIIC